MEPSQAINAIEASLRGLITEVLGDKWAEDAGIDAAEFEQRRVEEAQRRKGAVVKQRLLAYAHIYELRTIIHQNWVKFKQALGDEKKFDIYMDRIEDFRNAAMHSRELLPFERDLLSGIAGELRNVVTIFRSAQGPDGKHYPIVESIVDSFGTEIDVSSSGAMTPTGLRLKVGDRVQFACRGWDAQNRDLTWTLNRGLSEKIDRKTGFAVELEWIVTAKDVREQGSSVNIDMKSSGKYHRLGSWDASYTIIYAVDPPDG